MTRRTISRLAYTIAAISGLYGLMAARTIASAIDVGSAITGKVVDHDGRAIAGATVKIAYAWMRVGSSPYCPSCWADCSKTATSESTGRFEIKSVDRRLVFRVLCICKGYEPKMVDTDPQEHKPLKVALKSRPATPKDPRQIVSGQVVDSHGKPVVAALVEPFGCKQGGERWWGEVEDTDPLAVTDAQGHFEIVSRKPADGFDLQVTARALAKKNFALIPTAKSDNRLVMAEGATVRGRVLDHGHRVPGVRVGLVQANRSVERFLGAIEIGTDAHGEFLFANVPPNQDYCLYGIMNSLRDRGATAEQQIRVNADGSETKVDDLTVERAYRISGRIVLSDGKPVPPHTRVLFSRDKAWDSQIVETDSKGSFTIDGIPSGVIELTTFVEGYHLSDENKSLEPLNRIMLRGLADRNLGGLLVLLEPGKVRMPSTRMKREEWQQILDRRNRFEHEPLAGVSADFKAADRTAHTVERPKHQPTLARPSWPVKPLPKIELPPPLPKPVAADANVPKRAVHGRVVDERGRPIVGADLWYPVRWASADHYLTAHAISAADGQFRIEFPSEWLPKDASLIDTDGTIWAFARGHSIGLGSALDQITGRRNPKTLEIVLLQASNDDVLTILSPDQQPVAGARVAPADYDHLEIGLWERLPPELLAKTAETTDKQGHVCLHAFPLKKMLGVSIESPDYGMQEIRLEWDSGPRREIALQPVGRIEGRVVADQRALFRNMFVVVETGSFDSDEGKGLATLTVSDDGRFTVPKIASGPIKLFARLADARLPVRPRLIEAKKFSVAEGQTTRIEIPLESAVRARGVIREKKTGIPVPGAVVVVNYDASSQEQTVKCDMQGRYSATVLSGDVNMQVICVPGYDMMQPAELRSEKFEVPDGVADFELPPTGLVRVKTVSGRLLDKGGSALANYDVTGFRGTKRFAWAKTDGIGEFHMWGVPEEILLDRFTANPDTVWRPNEAAIQSKDPLVLRMK